MGKQFVGSTEDATTVILGAPRWKKGMKISGVVQRMWNSTNGPLCSLLLKEPITIDGEKTNKVSLGSMKGLNMALQAAGVGEDITFLQAGDAIVVEHTGLQKSDDATKNDMLLFKVAVNRP